MKKITVIDDEKDLVETIKSFLGIRGYDISYAYNGEDGLRVIREEKPDVVVLDVMMPKMDGRDVLVQMKKEETLKDIPVLLLTAKEEDIHREYCIEMGAYEFIPKPYNGKILLRQIEKIFEKKQRGEI